MLRGNESDRGERMAMAACGTIGPRLKQDEPYMPFYGQKQVQTRLYNEWLKSDDRRNADQAAARARALAPAQGVSLERTLKSYYRRYVMRAWVGLTSARRGRTTSGCSRSLSDFSHALYNIVCTCCCP